MSGFKVGDKVRFKPFQEEWRKQGPYYTEIMQEISKKTSQATVLNITNDGYIRLENLGYSWMPDWLLPGKTRVFK